MCLTCRGYESRMDHIISHVAPIARDRDACECSRDSRVAIGIALSPRLVSGAVSPIRERRAATLGCRSRASPGSVHFGLREFSCGRRSRPRPVRAGVPRGGGGVARAGPRASIVTHIDILRGAVSKGRAKFPPNLPNLREPASDQNYLAWASSKVSPCPRDRRASPSAPSFASRCFLRGSHVCW